MSDVINDAINPKHYAGLTPQPIEVIEAWRLGFNLGNCIKYISRAGNKPGADIVQDLEKAQWYLTREIGRLKQLRQQKEGQSHE